jgi:hypothetical protein
LSGNGLLYEIQVFNTNTAILHQGEGFFTRVLGLIARGGRIERSEEFAAKTTQIVLITLRARDGKCIF